MEIKKSEKAGEDTTEMADVEEMVAIQQETPPRLPTPSPLSSSSAKTLL